jgi:hypothetical protein
LRLLNNVGGVDFIQISLLLIGPQGLADFFRYRPWLPPSLEPGGLANFTPKTEKNDQFSTNNTSIKLIQQE